MFISVVQRLPLFVLTGRVVGGGKDSDFNSCPAAKYSRTLTMKIRGEAGGPEPASVLAAPPNTPQLLLLSATSDV